jgi:hypothetical protein
LRKSDYPGRRTVEEWRALPAQKRRDLARRAQCDLLGSFRQCANKRCRRARSCSGDACTCVDRLWKLTRRKPKTLRNEIARLDALANV